MLAVVRWPWNPSRVPIRQIVGCMASGAAGGFEDFAVTPEAEGPTTASPTRIKAIPRRRSGVIRNRFAVELVDTAAPGPNGARSRLKNDIRATPPRSRTVHRLLWS